MIPIMLSVGSLYILIAERKQEREREREWEREKERESEWLEKGDNKHYVK